MHRAHAAASPNVILVLTDDMGWTHTSVQMDPDIPGSKSDYYETPNLEALAAQGMRFSDAYGAGPICSPSRAAIFTGRSPAQVHMTDVLAAAEPAGAHYQSFYVGKPVVPPLPLQLLPETITVAERIKQYRPEYTTALFQKDHVGPHPLHFGFDQFDFHLRGYEPEGEDPKQMYSAVNRVSAFMEEQVQADNPFFMMLASPTPHAPYEATTASLNKFTAKPRGVNHTNPLVAAMTYDFDASLGMILDKVDQLGITENTYIIFTSDHGGTNSTRNNAPLFGGKGSLWEGGIRVPMIVKGPGIAPGSVSDVPVSGVDVFATVSDLLGISAPLGEGIESASLAPIFHNGGQLPAGESLTRAFGPDGELFFHFPHYSGISSPMSAVRDGDYKLVRVYGTNGAPDQVSLFNIAANIVESSSPASPLNLAGQMPGKTAELLAKLDTWLAGVDASMPAPAGAPYGLLWDAGQVGNYPSLWRSVNQVDDLRRESWNIVPNHFLPTPPTNATVATRVAAAPHQPGLSSHAFSFDGGDVMSTPFFRVSDPVAPDTFDNDHSATVEMWVKLTNLTRNQVLFESGGGTGGISLSVGDGNSDGVHDELRFRVQSANGQYATASAEIDLFASPTRDFVQLTAVINDDNANRYVELYVNGALMSRVDGAAGVAGRLDWDGVDAAGLGGAGGAVVGGHGGGGVLPFLGNLAGQIARVRFQDDALTSNQVLANYNSLLYPVDFGIASATGQVAVPAFRPSDVSLGASEAGSALVMQERADRLSSVLNIDANANGGGTITSTSSMPAGQLPAGTEFISYLVHFDLPGAAGAAQIVSGGMQFEHDILGLLIGDASLAATDALLGSIGDYGSALGRGLELQAGDYISITPDERTLNFRLTLAGDQLAQLRVLTSAPAPGDFDGDGQVTADDLLAWRQSFGINGAGDGDGDGDTDGADFLAWQRHAGESPAPLSVPEPSTPLILLAAARLAWVRRARLGKSQLAQQSNAYGMQA